MSRPTADEQLRFLLSCVKHANAGKIDFVEVAAECGIISKGAASKKFERLMKANGIYTSVPRKTTSKSVGDKSKCDVDAKAEIKWTKIEIDEYDIRKDDQDIKPRRVISTPELPVSIKSEVGYYWPTREVRQLASHERKTGSPMRLLSSIFDQQAGSHNPQPRHQVLTVHSYRPIGTLGRTFEPWQNNLVPYPYEVISCDQSDVQSHVTAAEQQSTTKFSPDIAPNGIPHSNGLQGGDEGLLTRPGLGNAMQPVVSRANNTLPLFSEIPPCSAIPPAPQDVVTARTMLEIDKTSANGSTQDLAIVIPHWSYC